MILRHENIDNSITSSYRIFRIKERKLYSYWHYHAEMEIVYIVKGEGIWMFGENVRRFSEGELLMIGQNIPHNFVTDKDIHEKDVETICVQFSKKVFDSFPEGELLADLFKEFDKGIIISDIDKAYKSKIFEMEKFQGNSIKSLIAFFELLEMINRSREKNFVLKELFHKYNFSLQHLERLNVVLDYIHSNYLHNISLTEISEIAHYTPHSFTRWFKKKMGLTFIEYLHKIKLAHACQLLISSNNSISNIALQSGFDNISTFNRLFKEQLGCSPTKFKQKKRR